MLTATAMPLALNEPVGSRPSSLTRISAHLKLFCSVGRAINGVMVSPRLTGSIFDPNGRNSR